MLATAEGRERATHDHADLRRLAQLLADLLDAEGGPWCRRLKQVQFAGLRRLLANMKRLALEGLQQPLDQRATGGELPFAGQQQIAGAPLDSRTDRPEFPLPARGGWFGLTNHVPRRVSHKGHQRGGEVGDDHLAQFPGSGWFAIPQHLDQHVLGVQVKHPSQVVVGNGSRFLAAVFLEHGNSPGLRQRGTLCRVQDFARAADAAQPDGRLAGRLAVTQQFHHPAGEGEQQRARLPVQLLQGPLAVVVTKRPRVEFAIVGDEVAETAEALLHRVERAVGRKVGPQVEHRIAGLDPNARQRPPADGAVPGLAFAAQVELEIVVGTASRNVLEHLVGRLAPPQRFAITHDLGAGQHGDRLEGPGRTGRIDPQGGLLQAGPPARNVASGVVKQLLQPRRPRGLGLLDVGRGTHEGLPDRERRAAEAPLLELQQRGPNSR